MTIKTKFDVGDTVCLDLGIIREGGIRGTVMYINVEVDVVRPYITYTVSYEGNAITVPESMLYSIRPIIHESFEEEDY